MTQFIDTPELALSTLEMMSHYPVVGVDSEFYGVDLSHDSCVGRSIMHVFSVAIPSGDLSPLGFNKTEDYVFPVTVQGLYSALEIPEIRAWLSNVGITKPVHNQPVDAHTFANHGVQLRGGVNTLSMARWLYPQLARASNRPFALDNLAQWRLGLSKTEGFEELLGYKGQRTFEVEGIKRRCSCGELSCMKKKPPHDVKTPELVKYEQTRTVDLLTPLLDLYPGHPLWARYCAYAGRDAVLATNMYQVMLRDGAKERPYPWNPIFLAPPGAPVGNSA